MVPAAVVLVVGTACGGRFGAPDAATTQGSEVLDLWRTLFLVGLAVGALVLGLVLWTVVRHRRPSAAAGGGALPDQVRANVPLEVVYTAVPLVIVVVLFLMAVRTQHHVTRLTSNPGLRVEATGFQWGWRFLYPVQQVKVLGDSNTPPTLVLPLGVTTRLVLESPDVVHSFYVPAFLVKEDVVPGSNNELDVTPTRAGRFGGYCAEFCGLDHTRMTFDVEVLEPPEFQRWVAEQQQRDQQGGTGDDPDPSASGQDSPEGQALGPTGVRPIGVSPTGVSPIGVSPVAASRVAISPQDGGG